MILRTVCPKADADLRHSDAGASKADRGNSPEATPTCIQRAPRRLTKPLEPKHLVIKLRRLLETENPSSSDARRLCVCGDTCTHGPRGGPPGRPFAPSSGRHRPNVAALEQRSSPRRFLRASYNIPRFGGLFMRGLTRGPAMPKRHSSSLLHPAHRGGYSVRRKPSNIKHLQKTPQKNSTQSPTGLTCSGP